MTKYEFLLAAKQCGMLKLLCREFGFPTHYARWMDIYAYHRAHPKLSQMRVSYHFGISQTKVSEAIRFMDQQITDTCIFLPLIGFSNSP